MSRGYHWLERKVLGTRLHDTATGYKFFRRESLLPLLDEIVDQGWFWDTEVMVRGYVKGYQIAEIPTLFLRRFDKQLTVDGLRDSLVYFQRLLQFKRMIDKQYGAKHGGATRDRPAESR